MVAHGSHVVHFFVVANKKNDIYIIQYHNGQNLEKEMKNPRL